MGAPRPLLERVPITHALDELEEPSLKVADDRVHRFLHDPGTAGGFHEHSSDRGA